MKRSRRLLVLTVGIVLVICLQFGFVPQAQCADTRIIRIYAQVSPGVSTRIEPPNLWVAPGTVVVFANWGKTEVKINFKEGAKCDAATVAAGGFGVAEGCYVTDMWIPYGGTTSLKFDKEGEYDYTVVYKNINAEEKGSLTVKTMLD